MKFPEWASTDIANVGNGDPNKEEPTDTQKTDGWTTEIPLLQHMNWIQNNFASWITNNNKFVAVAHNQVLTVGTVNIPNAGASVLLPASPYDGQFLVIAMQKGAAGQADVTLKGNGKGIMSAGTTEITLDLYDAVMAFRYQSSLGYWVVHLTGQVGG